MTITIQDDFAVGASETYAFTDEFGFMIPVRGDGTLSSFWNFGTISLAVDDGGAYAAVRCEGGDPQAIIENAAGGLIQAQGGEGSRITAIDCEYSPSIVNGGTINVRGDEGLGIRVYYGDLGQEVINSGLINVAGHEFARGIAFAYGGVVENSGVIKVHAPDGGAVAVAFGEFSAQLANTGRIVADSGSTPDSVGVEFRSFGDGSSFVNEGLIRADFAIQGDASHAAISNDGILDGDVWLTGSQQGFINNGKITGDILLGYDNDHYDGSHGRLDGAVYGGGGSDMLVCGRGDQVIYGDGNPDDGGVEGKDTLVGGAGADTLVGGHGSDSFLFMRLSDSLVGAADMVKDLSTKDVIDLSAVDADATHKGDQAFTLVATLDGHAGQAALTYDAGADLTDLSLDADGDGAADAVITIKGDHADFTNFVL